jgi:hypothetical protein
MYHENANVVLVFYAILGFRPFLLNLWYLLYFKQPLSGKLIFDCTSFPASISDVMMQLLIEPHIQSCMYHENANVILLFFSILGFFWYILYFKQALSAKHLFVLASFPASIWDLMMRLLI